jgi:hypothetical protein
MSHNPSIMKNVHHSKILRAAVSLFAIVLICGINASADVVWNAALDLVANEIPDGQQELVNPNATVPEWSYGYRPTITGTSLTNFSGLDFYNVTPYKGWNSYGLPYNVPYVYANVTGTPNDGGNTNELLLHPGNVASARTFVVVRWTAPIAGVFAIVAYWRGDAQQAGSDGVDVHVVTNGVSIFNQTIPANGSTSDSVSLTLSQGDTIDFVLGPNQNYNADGTIFNATITAPSFGQVKAEIYSTVAVDSAVNIAWASVSGEIYQVQNTSSLTPALWTSIGSPVAGDGTEKSVKDMPRNREKCFYRVLRLQ